MSWSRFARRPTLAVATLVAAVLVALLITTWIAGVPEPEVHDELTMLVTADVLAHGRLCEPTHPHWQHFEANYLLNEPCTQGKYPPGLPLYMAAGYLLTGQFIVGVWMSVAVMIASTAYAMYPVLSPRWALLGTLLVALRFGVAGDWALAYWGGSVAAAGGALVFGAVVRLPAAPTVRDGGLLSVGLIMLAFSRPYEGLVWSIPMLVALAVRIVRHQPPLRRLASAMATAFAVACCGLASLGYYNASVTGVPSQFPYTRYEHTHTATPLFVFQGFRPAPVLRNSVMIRMEEFLTHEANLGKRDWPRHKLVSLLGVMWDFSKPALFLGAFGLIGYRPWRNTTTVAAISTLGLLAAATLTTPTPAERYLSPAMISIFFLTTIGLAQLARRRWRAFNGRLIVAGIVGATVAASAAAIVAHILDARTSREWWASKRDIQARLLSTDGADLVFVRYDSDHNPHNEWVFNGANIDGRPIVWAREMGPEADRRLRTYFNNRKAWVVFADADPPRLVTWHEPDTR